MVFRGRNGSKQSFALFDSSTPLPRASWAGAGLSVTGRRVGLGDAVGLPAFMRGLRLISESAAGMPFKLYRGWDDARRPMPTASQLALLRRPNPDQSPFSVWAYTYVSLIQGNAYLYKIKDKRGRVLALYPVNPLCVVPKYEGMTATFDLKDRQYGPVVETVGRDKIIHVPGLHLSDPYIGVSIIDYTVNTLGSELDRQQYEGRFIANDGRPGTVLKHKGNPSLSQRKELRDGWESRHSAGQAGKLGMVWGGWEIDSLPISLQDAQFVETKRYSVQDIGRILGVPSGLLNDPDAAGGDSPEQENMRFLTHGVQPWLDRVEFGVAADKDLFPEPDWDIDHDAQRLLRADFKTRSEGHRLARQGGWKTGNEIRREEGLPDHPDGDKLQETPVGGAENPGQSSEPGKQADQEG